MHSQASTASPDTPLDMVIFGGVGDLSLRKLLPALFMAHSHGNLSGSTRIHVLGRQAWDDATFRAFIEEKVPPFIDAADRTPEAWALFVARLSYLALDATQSAGFAALGQALQPGSTRVHYLATSPSLFTTICSHLAANDLIDTQTRVVLEKPLGHDLASARQINDEVGKHFAEHQIFRIDHYLGKETVQNLMVLRFGNTIFEPLWRSPFIKSVQITVAESVGVGSRAGFYDGTGALRDMVQNHLLQLLCIVAMEPPVSLNPDAVRDEKAEGAALAAPHDGGRCGARHRARPVHRWRIGWRGCCGLPARSERAARQRHRNLRGPARAHQQLALGQRAHLFAHRQAHGRAAV
jgi:glucose-6-phosphate 1-dehydrogenase